LCCALRLDHLVYEERSVLAPEVAGRSGDRKSYYLNRGYLDFNIESTQVSITPDKRDIYIVVNISEGEKYTVSDVKIGGDPIVPVEELRRLVTIKPGDPFSRQQLTDTSKRITDRLGNEGYAFANANAVPDVDRDKRTVAFTFMIDPGRRVYVRRINIVGNTRTRTKSSAATCGNWKAHSMTPRSCSCPSSASTAPATFQKSRWKRPLSPGRPTRSTSTCGQGKAHGGNTSGPGILEHRQADPAGRDFTVEHLRQR